MMPRQSRNKLTDIKPTSIYIKIQMVSNQNPEVCRQIQLKPRWCTNQNLEVDPGGVQIEPKSRCRQIRSKS